MMGMTRIRILLVGALLGLFLATGSSPLDARPARRPGQAAGGFHGSKVPGPSPKYLGITIQTGYLGRSSIGSAGDGGLRFVALF